MRKTLLAAAAVAAVAFLVLHAAGGARADVTVSRVAYHGWKDCYRLSNAQADLVFVPQIGRIMRYGMLGGPNMLWENGDLAGRTADPAAKDWTNFGGDKLWPAPQERSGWPPDPDIDSAECAVEELPGHHLRVTGRASKKFGIRFIREIAMERQGPGVTIINTMENTSGRPVEWSVWEVAQVDDPAWAEISSGQASGLPHGFHTFDDPSVLQRGFAIKGSQPRGGASIQLVRDPKKSGKIGTDAPSQWARARVKDFVFAIMGERESNAAYPDKGCLQEIYSNPDPLKYMELELLSPIRMLKPGEKAAFTTRWRLEKARKD